MKKLDEKLMGISGSVPPSLHAAMEDARWDYKKNMSQFVRLAVESFAISEGFWSPDDEPKIDESELTDAQREAIAADEKRAAEAAEAAEAEAEAKAAEDAAAAKAEADAAAKAAENSQDQGTGDAPAEPTTGDAPAEPTKTTSRSRK